MNRNLLDDYIFVKPSEIHGSGVFTSFDIPEGTDITIISGEVISGEECERREAAGNVYIFWNGDNYIDTTHSGFIKYINHNCGSNCEVADRDNQTLLLVAKKDIPAGEELTIDYGYEEIYESCKCSTCLA